MKRLIYDIEQGFKEGNVEAYEGDKNNQEYFISLKTNEFRKTFNLEGKRVKMCFINKDTERGDLFDIEITEAERGMIKIPVVGDLTLADGIYFCQFRISGVDYTQHTKIFTIKIKQNIFDVVSGEIIQDERFKILLEALEKVENFESRIVEIDDKTKSNKKDIINLGTKVNTKIDSTNSEVTKLKKDISNTGKKIDNLDIAVKNLIDDGGIRVESSAYLLKRYSTNVELKPNTKYTIVLSGEVLENQHLGIYFNRGYVLAANYTHSQNNTAVKFQVTSPEEITSNDIDIYNAPNNSIVGKINWVCLYEGHEVVPGEFIKSYNDIIKGLSSGDGGNSNLIEVNKEISKINSKIANLESEVDDNSTELELLRGDFDTAEDRLIHEINKLAMNETNSGLIEYSSLEINAKDSVGGYANSVNISGKTFRNVTKTLGEWETDTNKTFAYILVDHTRIKPNTQYCLYIPGLNWKIERINFGAYAEDRYLPDTQAMFVNFTTPSTIFNKDTYVRIYAKSGQTLNEYDLSDKRIMLIEGGLSYLPEYFEDMYNSGYESDYIEITSQNKNLMPEEFIITENWQTTFNVNGQEVEISPTNANSGVGYVTTEPIYLLPNKTYTVSFVGNEDFSKGRVWKNGTHEDMSGNENSTTFTTTQRDFIVQIGLYVKNDRLDRRASVKVQIEENLTSSAYERPYKSSFRINLPFRGGLKSVPNTEDIISGTNIIENTKLYTLNERTEWNFHEESNGYVKFWAGKPEEIHPGEGNAICNLFNYVNSWDNEEHFHINEHGIYVTISTQKIEGNTVNDFKRWLTDNPMKVICRLKTPIVHQLEEKITLETFNEYTRIKINDKVSSVIDCSIITSLNSAVGRLDIENRYLRNQNITLIEVGKVLSNSILKLVEPTLLIEEEFDIIDSIRGAISMLNNVR